MEKTKKILMITSLSALGISCLMLIIGVFQHAIFEGVPLRFLLIFSTIAVSCGISISEVSIIKRKKILGYVGLSVLALSVLFALIIFCSPLLFQDNFFNRLTGIVSISSVLFIAIISIYSKLEKSLLGLQIPTYISLILLDILVSLWIGGAQIFEISGMLQVFIVLIIVCFGLLIASSVVSSKKKNSVESDTKIKNNLITISKVEYENLLNENKILKQQIEELKNQNK
mgnify:CR=1 FL=1